MNIWEQSFDNLRRPYLEEKNDGNLANNYPPYDTVTRGDVIAGATGKDQMGGKKKKMKNEERKLGGGMKPGGGYDRGYKAMQKEIEKLEKGEEPATAKRYKEMRKEHSDWRSDLGFFIEEDCGSGPMKPKKGIKNKVTINPDLKTEQATTGPVMKPGSGLGGGKLVYPKGQEPKATGAKLPSLQQAHYEPQGNQIDENPVIGLGIKAGLAAGTALAGKMVYDKAKGVADKLNQRNQQTQKAIQQMNSFEPEGEEISEREMTSGEMKKEKNLKKKYDDSGMKASMKKQYGAEKGKQVYFATIRKQAMEQFAGNYEGPLYAPHPDIEEAYKEIDREKENKMYRRAGNLARTALSSKGEKKAEAQKKSSNIVSAITRQKEKERFDRIGQSPKHNEALENELDYYLGEALRPASERMKRVQTDAGRKKQEKERTRKSKLEAEADKILAGYSKKGTGLAKTKPMSERREMDEPGERDTNPDVRRHNKMVGYKSKPKRPSIANDPRYGTVQDRSGKFKY